MIHTRKREQEKAGDANGPKITFELVNGGQLRVSTEWVRGADLDLFGHLLLYLCQGKLAGIISSSVAVQAMKTDQLEQGAMIHSLLQQVRPAQATDHDDPVVCPTQAVRMNIKPFQG